MAEETKPAAPSDTKKKRPPRPERVSVTTHETTIGGKALTYTAEAGTLSLKTDEEEDRASVFYVSYVVVARGGPSGPAPMGDNASDGRSGDPAGIPPVDGRATPTREDASSRPVTFCFNGGPGSSSVWLQFGAFGPRRVDIPDTVAPRPAPYRLVDNDSGILDLTDLVFVDPVGTGFSRPVGDTAQEAFLGVEEDVAAVGEFIVRWLSRHDRWNSAKLLAGESYGTTRGAALAHWLQDRGVMLNGLVLLSLALNFQTFVFEPGNDLPEILYLPTYAATAHYHGRIAGNPPLEPFLDEVRRFALEEYAPALLTGARLDPQRRKGIAERLAAYTGLPAAEIERRKLRIEYMWFAKQVLGVPGRTVGRLDSRYLGDDLDPAALTAARDPSYDAIYGAYAATVNDYLRRQLLWKSDDEYEVLSLKVNMGWRWSHGKRLGFVNTTEELRLALVTNPHLKVLLASGLYDLATPFFGAEYTVDHLEVEPAIRENVILTYYDAGHMMYVHPPSLAKLRADLVAFYASATAR